MQNLSSLAEHNKSSERLSTKQRLMVASRFEGPQKSQPGIGHHGENFAKLVNVTPHVPLAVAVNSPSIILEEPCATVTPLGSSINLILSFDQQPPEGSLQQGPVEPRQAVEPVHRVSTDHHIFISTYHKTTSTKLKREDAKFWTTVRFEFCCS